MHQITVFTKSRDRVVTAARVNSGAESLAGLNDDQRERVMVGDSVVLKSRRAPSVTAVVKLHTARGSWEYEGLHNDVPDLDALPNDAARQEALSKWAKSVHQLAAY